MFYLFTKRDMPDPGAQNWALATFRLPDVPLLGTGTQVGQRGTLYASQVPVLQNTTAVGLGGPVAGQFMSTPLVDLETEGWQLGPDASAFGDGVL